MKANVTKLPVGTKFHYEEYDYEVTDTSDYPFILAKCLTEPNEFQGSDVMFARFEQVEVADETELLDIQPIVYSK
ncbi:MAG: hypothetical protein IKQ20_03575 [Bacteroidales bacterium]|nr:hypothetical protein [Bacteroidales bacterium]